MLRIVFHPHGLTKQELRAREALTALDAIENGKATLTPPLKTSASEMARQFEQTKLGGTYFKVIDRTTRETEHDFSHAVAIDIVAVKAPTRNSMFLYDELRAMLGSFESEHQLPPTAECMVESVAL